jgi:fused signal recognition particle receptor
VRGLFNKLKESLSGAKLRESLSRTREAFADNVHKVLTGRPRLDEATFEELEEVLIAGDVGVAAAEKLVSRLRERAQAEGLADGAALEEALAEEVAAILKAGESTAPVTTAVKPWVVMLVGVNGTGKTTTLGKLANHYRREGKSVVVGAADTFRAAAVEQLRIWAERAGVEIVANQSGADPASVAYDAVAAAQARNADVVLVDTAGTPRQLTTARRGFDLRYTVQDFQVLTWNQLTTPPWPVPTTAAETNLKQITLRVSSTTRILTGRREFVVSALKIAG